MVSVIYAKELIQEAVEQILILFVPQCILYLTSLIVCHSRRLRNKVFGNIVSVSQDLIRTLASSLV